MSKIRIVLAEDHATVRQGLKLLIDEKFLRPNAPDGKLKDPWDRDYVYLYPGQTHPDGFDVKSYGADGQPGGGAGGPSDGKTFFRVARLCSSVAFRKPTIKLRARPGTDFRRPQRAGPCRNPLPQERICAESCEPLQPPNFIVHTP